MKISKILLTAAILSLPLAANAAEDDAGKFYLSLTGEYIVSADAEGDFTSDAGNASTSVDYSNGAGGLAAVGYYLEDNFRVEAEAGYRQFNSDTVTATAEGVTETRDISNGETDAITFMGNVFYNFHTGIEISPYIGAGAGWVSDTKNNADAFAYQAMVGLDYQVSENSSVFAGYRYFATTDFKIESQDANLGHTAYEPSIKSHGVDVGYRVSF